MFTKSAKYYDAIYAAMDKDYSAEANKAHQFIQKHKRSEGNTLLDIACGTGTHAEYFSRYYKVDGLDVDSNMLEVARSKHPNLRFHQGDMTSFQLGRQFDVVVSLFSSIGYAKTKSRLQKAIRNMNRHLLPGGVLLVEPWFTPEQWKPGGVFTIHVDKPDLRIVRMSRSGQRGKISLLEFQYLVGTSEGIEHYTEIHELGLFTRKDYMDAFKAADLTVTHDSKGLDGRGLYIGRKSTE